MTRLFVDTSFYSALLNPNDGLHSVANEVSKSVRGHFVTSEYVLLELGSMMSRGFLRGLFVELVESVRADPRTQVVAASDAVFNPALSLFRNRPDKEWSLTDCTSIILMQRYGLTEILSSDHHFEQAGFAKHL